MVVGRRFRLRLGNGVGHVKHSRNGILGALGSRQRIERFDREKNKKWRGLLFKTGQFRSNADTTRASRMAGVRQPGRWEPNGRVQEREKYSKVLNPSQSITLEFADRGDPQGDGQKRSAVLRSFSGSRQKPT